MSKSVEAQLTAILEEYNKEVDRSVAKAAVKAGQRTAARLRGTSPKDSGKYARGWGYKTEKGFGGSVKVTVHNKTEYRLTHLLENGHVAKNQFGTYGRVGPRVHIKPAEETGNALFLTEVSKDL